jgi:tagatose-1,6-bisphosphate aldolase non-catalytic subunit AgaZ/GatZ
MLAPLGRNSLLCVHQGVPLPSSAVASRKRELIAIGLEEVTEVEPVALRFVISHEARCRGEVEQAIVTVHGAMEFADFGVRYPVAFGPKARSHVRA